MPEKENPEFIRLIEEEFEAIGALDEKQAIPMDATHGAPGVVPGIPFKALHTTNIVNASGELADDEVSEEHVTRMPRRGFWIVLVIFVFVISLAWWKYLDFVGTF